MRINRFIVLMFTAFHLLSNLPFLWILKGGGDVRSTVLSFIIYE